MENHGAVAVGETPLDAFRRIEVLEFLCRLVVTARSAGLTLRGIGADAVAALRASYGAKPRR
ncbi:hypothetical protein HRbin27_01646 [bacterium HR27]|nr:hypothetical protein HRbin27_01646 [bacterium HR27]